jgi:hypothetical protein
MGAEVNERCIPQFVLDDTKRYQAEDLWEGDKEDLTPYHKRRAAGVWAGMATLAVALAVVTGYGYFVLSRQDAQLAQIPGLASSLPAINQHLSSMEKRLGVWRDNQQALAGEMQRMDAGWKTALAAAQDQTARLVAMGQLRLSKEMAARTQTITVQLAQLESNQRAYRSRMSQLEGQLAEARTQMAALHQNYSRELAALREQQAEARREIVSLNDIMTTRQVAFEIHKDEWQEIVPGVSLHLTDTDVRHQRVDGWIEKSPGGGRLWMRGQGIEQPFVFYPHQQDAAYALVVTQVDAKQASGYVLIPKTNGAFNLARFDRQDGSTTPVTLFPVDQSTITGP